LLGDETGLLLLGGASKNDLTAALTVSYTTVV
jgi:hypothetical protein